MRILFESDHLALWNFQNLNKQLESDDNYLSYVQFHDGDVAMASFHLACELSCGKGTNSSQTVIVFNIFTL
jgi:hypothetical protein